MVSIIVLVAIAVGVGWIVWRRRAHWRTPTAANTPERIIPETMALDAFTYGNACLAAGKFAEATAAFQRSRELDPKRPYVADRLAEVERQQHASISSPAAALS